MKEACDKHRRHLNHLFRTGVALVMTAVLGFSGFAAEKAPEKAVTYKYGPKISEWNTRNKDIQGWVYIDGTNINYPIAYPGKEKGNNYYMSRGYDLKPSRNSVIWADKNTRTGGKSEISKNTILYGHNWNNISSNPRIGSAKDTMFGQLPAFHHLDFAKEHQFIQYSTEKANMVFQVFAVFYTEIDFAYNVSNPETEQFRGIIDSARARSLHDYNIEVGTDDHILTLSTCTRAYGKSDQQRFVVMAKRVPSGTECVSVTENPDFQKPKL